MDESGANQSAYYPWNDDAPTSWGDEDDVDAYPDTPVTPAQYADVRDQSRAQSAGWTVVRRRGRSRSNASRNVSRRGQPAGRGSQHKARPRRDTKRGYASDEGARSRDKRQRHRSHPRERSAEPRPTSGSERRRRGFRGQSTHPYVRAAHKVAADLRGQAEQRERLVLRSATADQLFQRPSPGGREGVSALPNAIRSRVDTLVWRPVPAVEAEPIAAIPNGNVVTSGPGALPKPAAGLSDVSVAVPSITRSLFQQERGGPQPQARVEADPRQSGFACANQPTFGTEALPHPAPMQLGEFFRFGGNDGVTLPHQERTPALPALSQDGSAQAGSVHQPSSQGEVEEPAEQSDSESSRLGGSGSDEDVPRWDPDFDINAHSVFQSDGSTVKCSHKKFTVRQRKEQRRLKGLAAKGGPSLGSQPDDSADSKSGDDSGSGDPKTPKRVAKQLLKAANKAAAAKTAGNVVFGPRTPAGPAAIQPVPVGTPPPPHRPAPPVDNRPQVPLRHYITDDQHQWLSERFAALNIVCERDYAHGHALAHAYRTIQVYNQLLSIRRNAVGTPTVWLVGLKPNHVFDDFGLNLHFNFHRYADGDVTRYKDCRPQSHCNHDLLDCKCNKPDIILMFDRLYHFEPAYLAQLVARFSQPLTRTDKIAGGVRLVSCHQVHVEPRGTLYQIGEPEFIYRRYLDPKGRCRIVVNEVNSRHNDYDHPNTDWLNAGYANFKGPTGLKGLPNKTHLSWTTMANDQWVEVVEFVLARGQRKTAPARLNRWNDSSYYGGLDFGMMTMRPTGPEIMSDGGAYSVGAYCLVSHGADPNAIVSKDLIADISTWAQGRDFNGDIITEAYAQARIFSRNFKLSSSDRSDTISVAVAIGLAHALKAASHVRPAIRACEKEMRRQEEGHIPAFHKQFTTKGSWQRKLCKRIVKFYRTVERSTRDARAVAVKLLGPIMSYVFGGGLKALLLGFLTLNIVAKASGMGCCDGYGLLKLITHVFEKLGQAKSKLAGMGKSTRSLFGKTGDLIKELWQWLRQLGPIAWAVDFLSQIPSWFTGLFSDKESKEQLDDLSKDLLAQDQALQEAEILKERAQVAEAFARATAPDTSYTRAARMHTAPVFEPEQVRASAPTQQTPPADISKAAYKPSPEMAAADAELERVRQRGAALAAQRRQHTEEALMDVSNNPRYLDTDVDDFDDPDLANLPLNERVDILVARKVQRLKALKDQPAPWEPKPITCDRSVEDFAKVLSAGFGLAGYRKASRTLGDEVAKTAAYAALQPEARLLVDNCLVQMGVDDPDFGDLDNPNIAAPRSIRRFIRDMDDIVTRVVLPDTGLGRVVVDGIPVGKTYCSEGRCAKKQRADAKLVLPHALPDKCRERVLYCVGGCFSEVRISQDEYCIHNELSGTKGRVLLEVPMPVQDFWPSRVRAFGRTFKLEDPIDADCFEAFAKRFPTRKKERLYRGRDNNSVQVNHRTNSRTSAHVKVELNYHVDEAGNNVDHDPRLIQASTAEESAEIGPSIWALQSAMTRHQEDGQKGLFGKVFFCIGKKAEEVDTALHYCESRLPDGPLAYLTADGSRQDAHMHREIDCCFARMLEVNGVEDAVIEAIIQGGTIRGRTSYFIIYRTKDGLRSGRMVTSLFNSTAEIFLINEVLAKYNGFALNSSDDNLIVCYARDAHAIKAELIRTHLLAGIELEVVVTRDRVRAEFCSGRFWSAGNSYGFAFGPKMGKLLPKLFVMRDPHVLGRIDKHVRGVSIGLLNSVAHLPVCRAYILRHLQLAERTTQRAPTSKSKDLISKMEHRITRIKAAPFSERIYDDYALIYGIGRSELEVVEQDIMAIERLPAKINAPFMLRANQIDKVGAPTLEDTPGMCATGLGLGAAVKFVGLNLCLPNFTAHLVMAINRWCMEHIGLKWTAAVTGPIVEEIARVAVDSYFIYTATILADETYANWVQGHDWRLRIAPTLMHTVNALLAKALGPLALIFTIPLHMANNMVFLIIQWLVTHHAQDIQDAADRYAAWAGWHNTSRARDVLNYGADKIKQFRAFIIKDHMRSQYVGKRRAAEAESLGQRIGFQIGLHSVQVRSWFRSRDRRSSAQIYNVAALVRNKMRREAAYRDTDRFEELDSDDEIGYNEPEKHKEGSQFAPTGLGLSTGRGSRLLTKNFHLTLSIIQAESSINMATVISGPVRPARRPRKARGARRQARAQTKVEIVQVARPRRRRPAQPRVGPRPTKARETVGFVKARSANAKPYVRTAAERNPYLASILAPEAHQGVRIPDGYSQRTATVPALVDAPVPYFPEGDSKEVPGSFNLIIKPDPVHPVWTYGSTTKANGNSISGYVDEQSPDYGLRPIDEDSVRFSPQVGNMIIDSGVKTNVKFPCKLPTVDWPQEPYKASMTQDGSIFYGTVVNGLSNAVSANFNGTIVINGADVQIGDGFVAELVDAKGTTPVNATILATVAGQSTFKFPNTVIDTLCTLGTEAAVGRDSGRPGIGVRLTWTAATGIPAEIISMQFRFFGTASTARRCQYPIDMPQKELNMFLENVDKQRPVSCSALCSFTGNAIEYGGQIASVSYQGGAHPQDIDLWNYSGVVNNNSNPYKGLLKNGTYVIWKPRDVGDQEMQPIVNTTGWDRPYMCIAGIVQETNNTTMLTLRVWTNFEVITTSRFLTAGYGRAQPALIREAMYALREFPLAGPNDTHLASIRRFLGSAWQGAKDVITWANDNKGWLVPAGMAVASLL